ncbi:MAG: hypothetical protein IIZ39_07795 [Blautia sp.]|nr:hypothetical protein [Blautia sp.]
MKRRWEGLMLVFLAWFFMLVPVWGAASPEKVRLLSVWQSLSSRTASITWKKVQGAKGYEVSISDSKDFAREQVFFWEGDKTSFTGEYGKRYYVRVRAAFEKAVEGQGEAEVEKEIEKKAAEYCREKETEEVYGPWSRTVSCKLERPVFRRQERRISREKKIEVSWSGSLFMPRVSGTYADGFWMSSEREDVNLLRLSALALYAAYEEGSKVPWQGDVMQGFLEDCGFATEGIVSFFTGRGEESRGEDYDHCTIYTASKKLEESAYGKRRLIALVINGYSRGGFEWLSNLSLGDGNVHEGFLAAAEEVVSFLIHQYPDLSDSILWICGHSRGAAITNLVAKQLLEEEEAPIIYAYGFATPNVQRKEGREETEEGGTNKNREETEEGETNKNREETEEGEIEAGREEIEKEKESILNLINLGDLVPELPPHEWGYDPLGRVYSFAMDAKARRVYWKFFRESYQGMKQREKDALLEELLDAAGQQEDFSQDGEENLSKILFSWDQRTVRSSLLRSMGVNRGWSLLSSHSMEAYLAFLFSHHLENGVFVAD